MYKSLYTQNLRRPHQLSMGLPDADAADASTPWGVVRTHPGVETDGRKQVLHNEECGEFDIEFVLEYIFHLSSEE